MSNYNVEVTVTLKIGGQVIQHGSLVDTSLGAEFAGRVWSAFTGVPKRKPWGFHIQFNNGKDATFKGLSYLEQCEALKADDETITLLYEEAKSKGDCNLHTNTGEMTEQAMKLVVESNRYFTSMNGVDVPERVSVPRDEWRSLFAKQPAQPQHEPVAVPTTSYEHRKFVFVGREWYERFAAFHDDCQIGEQLTWQEKTIRQQGYENGWNDAQRYLKEPQATSPPTPAQRKPLTEIPLLVDYAKKRETA